MIDDIKYTFFGILIVTIAFIVVGLLIYNITIHKKIQKFKNLTETENEYIANIRHWIGNIAAGITAFLLLLILLYALHELGESLYMKIFN